MPGFNITAKWKKGVLPLPTMKLTRTKDPATSHAAGRKAARRLSHSQSCVAIILHGVRLGMTDGQIEEYAAHNQVFLTPSRLRTARCELVRAGKVKEAGTSVNSRGNRCRVWTLA